MDSEPFGLSAEDAVEIITYCCAGYCRRSLSANGPGMPRTPLDLEEFKKTIHTMAV